MSSAAQPLRDRISFGTNQPTEIQLERGGSPSESTARDGSSEYRYFLAHHQIMWVPEDVHQAIQRDQAGPDGQFAVTKHRAPKPWTVIHLDATEPAAGWTAPDQQPAPPAPPARPAPAPVAAPRPRQEPTPAQPQQQSLPAEQPFSTSMYSSLCAAIKTAQAAEEYGQHIGRPVAFDTSDIRAIAATLFIHATGGR